MAVPPRLGLLPDPGRKVGAAERHTRGSGRAAARPRAADTAYDGSDRSAHIGATYGTRCSPGCNPARLSVGGKWKRGESQHGSGSKNTIGHDISFRVQVVPGQGSGQVVRAGAQELLHLGVGLGLLLPNVSL